MKRLAMLVMLQGLLTASCTSSGSSGSPSGSGGRPGVGSGGTPASASDGGGAAVAFASGGGPAGTSATGGTGTGGTGPGVTGTGTGGGGPTDEPDAGAGGSGAVGIPIHASGGTGAPTPGSGGTVAGGAGAGASSAVGGGSSGGGSGGKGVAGGGAAGTGGTPAAGGVSGATGGTTPSPCAAPIPVTTGAAATVTVNLSTPRATVGPDLMGLHVAVYDGRLGTPAVLGLLRAAGVKSLRYPGGSYADIYHWETHTAVTTAPAMGAGSSAINVLPGTDFGHFVSILQSVGANAFITLNYGSSSDGTGPGVPQEAAAWVAYANAMPDNTAVIGVDGTGRNWGTAGDWARLRAAMPVAGDADHMNILRIGHPQPIGVKYWELGNELYGNGFFGVGGPCGWEVDLHVSYGADGKSCSGRVGNAALSPTTYGAALRAFSSAIKSVDPTVKLGAIVLWPVVNGSYPNWNATVLAQACAPTPVIDFVVNHWYPGTTIASLRTLPGNDIPAMYRDLHGLLSSACGGAAGAAMPIAVTEWGPDTLYSGAAIGAAFNPPAPAQPSQTQVGGLFAAESYANFMEQGALAVHFQQLHPGASGATYLDGNDNPSWGYHGQLIAHHLADVGDMLVQATSTAATVLPHAALRVDGGINVMLTNINPSLAANVTVNLAPGAGAFACAGTRYDYLPVANNVSGPVSTGQPIYASQTGGSVAVGVPPDSVVVVSFPRR